MRQFMEQTRSKIIERGTETPPSALWEALNPILQPILCKVRFTMSSHKIELCNDLLRKGVNILLVFTLNSPDVTQMPFGFDQMHNFVHCTLTM